MFKKNQSKILVINQCHRVIDNLRVNYRFNKSKYKLKNRFQGQTNV